MTDRLRELDAQVPHAPRRLRKPSAMPIITGSAATFAALLTFLAIQVRDGRDPALGAGKPAVAAAPQRRILLRRIEEKVIIKRVIPAPTPAATATASGAATSAAPSYTSAPRYSAPAAPARVYTPPPPAPAPVVTRTS